MVKTKFIAVLICTAIFISLVPFSAFAKSEYPEGWKKCIVNYDDALATVNGTITNVEDGSSYEGFEVNINDSNFAYSGYTAFNGVANGYYMQWRLPWEVDGQTDTVDVDFTIQYNDFAEYFLGGYNQLRRIEFALKSFFISGGYAQPAQNFEIWFVNGNNNILLSKRTSVDNPTTEFNIDYYCDSAIDPNAHFRIKFKSAVPYTVGQSSFFRINIMYAGNALWLENPDLTLQQDEDKADNAVDDFKDKADAFESEADKVIGEIDKNTMPDLDDVTLSPELENEFDVDIDNIEIEDIGNIYDTDSKTYKLLIILAFSSLSIAVAGYVLHGKR